MNTKRGRGRAAATLSLISAIMMIAEKHQPCSVRAVAYQLFGRKLIRSMARNEVAKVSRLCVIAREEGTMPWEWIVDPTRQEQQVPTWADPDAYARVVQRAYRRNKWQDQPTHVSVWSEKATVEGTLRPVLERYEVPFQVLHGWSGATPVMDAARANLERHQDTLILYVGDYDPSGLGMSELDLPQRLARYSTATPANRDMATEEVEGILADVRLEIRRVALTKRDTVQLGRAPAFPVTDKRDDPRYEWFVRNYGDWCWELDALDPNDLRDRVEEAIVNVLDVDAWDRYVRVERAEREAIAKTCRSWGSILQQDQEYSASSTEGGHA